MAEVRGLFTDRICNADIKIKTNLMGNCRKMKHGIGGTAKRHVYSQRVHDGILCHNVPCTDIFMQHIHNSHAGMLCKLDSFRINRRNSTISAKPHPKRLRQAVHGIGSIHAGAGTAGRTYLVFKFSHILFRHASRRIGTHGFKHGRKASLFSLHTSGKHRTS